MHEEKLAKACKKGDKNAQKELFDRYSEVLYCTCLRYASNQFEADDFFQEGFMNILRNFKKFNFIGEGSLQAWMCRVMVNSSITLIRKKKKNLLTVDDSNENSISDVVEEENDEFHPGNRHDMVSKTNFSQEELIEELNKLPEQFRIVFNLHIVDGLKHNEIANMLGIKEKTSRTRLLRAKRMLQDNLYEKVKNKE
ncbi:MAG: sigma-70 family RNA polymerase sigma factor [Bacteroidales bacterium]|nr:sigma-70 family RNA polymerase sigma factor [Bacteroidales bacterium]